VDCNGLSDLKAGTPAEPHRAPSLEQKTKARVLSNKKEKDPETFGVLAKPLEEARGRALLSGHITGARQKREGI